MDHAHRFSRGPAERQQQAQAKRRVVSLALVYLFRGVTVLEKDAASSLFERDPDVVMEPWCGCDQAHSSVSYGLHRYESRPHCPAGCGRFFQNAMRMSW